MIEITADTRRAIVTNKELLTVGSAGIEVQFTLSEDWGGLAKMAVFRVGDDGPKYDVALGADLLCVAPPEVFETEGEVLFIGIYGSNGSGTIIIPTVWASAGIVKPGTAPNTTANAEPTPEIWAQILSVATDAEQTANEAYTMAENAQGYVVEQMVMNAVDTFVTDIVPTAEQAIEDKGQEILDTLPDDYIALDGHFNSLEENIVLVQETMPSSPDNRIWVDPTDEEIELPTIEEVQNYINSLNETKQDKPRIDGTAGQVLGLDEQLKPVWLDRSSGDAVTSVNGKTGAVQLDAGDIEFADSETYAAGSVGAELSQQKNAINQKIDDVQLNGISIKDDGIANIKIGSGLRLTNNADRSIMISEPARGNIRTRASNFGLTPAVQDLAVFYGLAWMAGDTTQAALTANEYTENAKSAIHTMLNAPVTVSGTTPTIAAKDGITYVCGEVATLDITLPASGIFEVQFVSGSTPTVLTATGVSWVGGFDPTALEANKTYDISISNGIGVAVWI